MSIMAKARKLLCDLRSSRNGTVAVEFALILPFALFVYFGGSYTSGLVTLNKKMQSAAYAMVNTVPFPRTVCSYRMHIENMYGSGFQLEAMQHLLYPFPVNENNTTVRYSETAPDADGKFTSRVRIEYQPTDGGLKALATMMTAFGSQSNIPNSTVWAESSNVTITRDIPVCPDLPLNLNFDPNPSVSYFEILNGSAYNNTVTASGGVRFKSKYRSYTATNLPPGIALEGLTGKFGTMINYPCQASNPGCQPVTWPTTVFSVQDYRDKLYDSPPDTATRSGQFVIYYPVSIANSAGSGVIFQGQALGTAYQPDPIVKGGWRIGGATKGYSFTSTGLPAGLWVDGSNGNIYGTTTVWPGTFIVTITATDARGATASVNYSLEVRAHPLNVAAADLNVVYGNYGSSGITASGGAGVLTVTCSGLPAGMTCAGNGASGTLGIWQTVGSIYGTPTVIGTYRPTISVTDQAGNTASTINTISISMPPATSSFGGWVGTTAGAYSYGYTYTAGGSGNFSLYSCSAPAGMSCTQSGRHFYMDGYPAPGTSTAYLQFRDNVSGVIYTQYISYSFAPAPISVWAAAYNPGDSYAGTYVYITYGWSGGYGGITSTSCSGSPANTSWNVCHGTVNYGSITSCISVWDTIGQGNYACYGFYINPRPISAYATMGFQFTYCRYGCIGYQNFNATGGVQPVYISQVTSSPEVWPGVSYWDGVTGQISTNYGQWNAQIYPYVADQIGQQVIASGMGF